MKRSLSLFLAVLSSLMLAAASFAQSSTHSVSVTLLDASNNEPVSYATVSVTAKGSTQPAKYALTSEKGSVTLDGLRDGTYTFAAEMMGYLKYEKEITVKGANVALGEVKLELDREMLEAASVTDVGAPVTIKKDTIEYNAGAFKTTENDVLEDLLKKLPGVEVNDDGSIKITFSENAPMLNGTIKTGTYDSAEFPIWAILYKDLDEIAGGASLWYCAGDVWAAQNDSHLSFDWSEGDYDMDNDDGWRLICVDLSDELTWEGDIHSYRLDIAGDGSLAEQTADIKWIGFFRNEKDAYNYADMGAYYEKEYGTPDSTSESAPATQPDDTTKADDTQTTTEEEGKTTTAEPAATTNKPAEQGKKSNTGAIIGIVAGVVVVAAAAACGIILSKKKKK